MINSDGIITEPISVSDPYYAMGVGMYNGQFDLGYICGNKHGKINPYSKFKPVVYPTYYAGKDNTPDYYKAIYSDISPGENGNCGLSCDSIGYSTGITGSERLSLIKSMINRNWLYKAPLDGIDWNRITDFIDYSHYANKLLYRYSRNIQINLINNKILNVYISFADPDDSDNKYSLNFRDFTNKDSLLYFKKIRLWGILAKSGNQYDREELSSGYLLNEDNTIGETSISFDLSDLAYGTYYDLYICLVREYDGGGKKIFPLPRFSIDATDVNNFPIEVQVLAAPTPDTGIGIEDLINDVMFSPKVQDSVWKTYGDSIYSENGSYIMQNEDGLLYVEILFTNNSNSTATATKSEFTASCYSNNQIRIRPQGMSLTKIGGSITSFTVPAKGTTKVYFQYPSLLYNSTVDTGLNSLVEIEFFLKGLQLFSGELYYRRGNAGWVQR